jgi:hypothetical protein
VGEINKSKLKREISMEEFIDEGVRILNDVKLWEKIDVYDKIKIVYVIKILKEISNNIYKK